MHNHSKSPVRLLTFVIIGAMAIFILLANRQERASSLSRLQKDPERQKIIEKFLRNKLALPEVDYSAAESRMETQSKLRKARAKRYRTGDAPFVKQRDDTVEIDAI